MAWTDEHGRVSVLALSQSESTVPLILDGSALLIWSSLSDSSFTDQQSIVENVASAAGAAAGDVSAEIVFFLKELQDRSIVERRAGELDEPK